MEETTTHQRTQGAISTELQQSPALSWSQSGDSPGAGAEGKDTAVFTEMVFGSSIEHAILRPLIQSEQHCARTLQDKLLKCHYNHRLQAKRHAGPEQER